MKAHIGIHGNEVADFLAKIGSSLGEGPTDELLTPQVKQKFEIQAYFHRKWANTWASYSEARQTKIWFPKPNSKKSSILLRLERNNPRTAPVWTHKLLKNLKTPFFSRYSKFLPVDNWYRSRTKPKFFSKRNSNKYGR